MTETEQFDRAMSLATLCSPRTPSEEMDDVLRACFPLSQFDRDRVIHVLAKKTKIYKGNFHALFKVLEARKNNDDRS